MGGDKLRNKNSPKPGDRNKEVDWGNSPKSILGWFLWTFPKKNMEIYYLDCSFIYCNYCCSCNLSACLYENSKYKKRN